MVAMKEKTEKKLLLLLKREDNTGLKVITGPDGRMRLCLDRSLAADGRKNTDLAECLVLHKTKTTENNVLIDVPG